MPDYIYLLESRLSPAQRQALKTVAEVARQKGQTIFLVGGAVRDLTSGSPVRDLDVVVQGSAVKLKKELAAAGAVITGEYELGQSLHLLLPGSVRMEFGSTLSVSYPKPGKPVYKSANILDDLRRRDFTANAMALSLNPGSYGLLMDPLNGVADIENRQLRLVSNYGFIEDPVRMIRAVRLMSRLGWMLDEKTQTRYEAGKQEGYISALSDYLRGYETEEIVHEEDPLRILRGLEAEGWMKVLAPFWTVAKANVPELERLRDLQTQLQMQGMTPDTASAQFPLLTAKLSAKEIAILKTSFPRQGFVTQVEALEAEAKDFATQLTGKGAALPSQSWTLLSAARPEVVLWTAFTSKNAALQAKFQAFLKEWPQARQKMPYVLMQEMRIVPELPGYEALLESLFFELMDGKLTTPEEMKAFLEPHSPPAPPPPVNLRRPRVAKKEAKSKSRAKKAVPAESETDNESPETAADASGENPTVESVNAGSSTAVASKPAAAAPRELPVKPAAPQSDKPAAKPSPRASLPGKAATKSAPVKAPAKAVVPNAPGKKTVASSAKPAKAASKKVPAPVKLAAKSKPAPPSKVSATSSLPKKGAEKAIGKPATRPVKEPAKTVAKPAAKKAITGKPIAKAAAKKATPTKAVSGKRR